MSRSCVYMAQMSVSTAEGAVHACPPLPAALSYCWRAGYPPLHLNVACALTVPRSRPRSSPLGPLGATCLAGHSPKARWRRRVGVRAGASGHESEGGKQRAGRRMRHSRGAVRHPTLISDNFLSATPTAGERFRHEDMSALPLLMRQQLGAASRLHSAMHAGLRLPTLDWGRFHLQLLFVDTTHGVKASSRCVETSPGLASERFLISHRTVAVAAGGGGL